MLVPVGFLECRVNRVLGVRVSRMIQELAGSTWVSMKGARVFGF